MGRGQRLRLYLRNVADRRRGREGGSLHIGKMHSAHAHSLGECPLCTCFHLGKSSLLATQRSARPTKRDADQDSSDTTRRPARIAQRSNAEASDPAPEVTFLRGARLSPLTSIPSPSPARKEMAVALAPPPVAMATAASVNGGLVQTRGGRPWCAVSIHLCVFPPPSKAGKASVYLSIARVACFSYAAFVSLRKQIVIGRVGGKGNFCLNFFLKKLNLKKKMN